MNAVTSEKPRILYVDDEKEHLTNFRYVFRKMYDIYLAESACEALEIMRQHDIEVVIADQRMPGKTGVEFLEQIRSEYPKVIRIMLTAYADADAMFQAINIGEIYRFIIKPWDKNDFKATIDSAIRVRRLTVENELLLTDLQQRLEEKDRLLHQIRKSEEEGEFNEYRLKTLLQLNQMTDASDQEIIDYTLEEAIKLTRSQIGYIYFVDEDRGTLTLSAWSKEAMKQCLTFKKTDYKLEETGLWGEAVRQRKAVITNDYSLPNPLKRGYPEGHVPVLRHMNTPIFDNERIVALIGVGNKENPYDEGDARQLTLLMQGMWRHLQRRKSDEERIKLEKQLRQAQKMEAIGTLAGGIAHDFNNILAPIIGYLEMVLDNIPEESQNHMWLNNIMTSANRAVELVKQILTFSRQTEKELRPLNLQLVIREVLKLIRSGLPSSIEIVENVDRECGCVMADPTQIHQITMNLITNAFHAMQDTGGTLKISLSRADISFGEMNEPDMLPGEYICLTVSDTGMGMSRSVLDRIFDPYFSTKEKEEGTGLGLTVVHGIVRNYGGAVKVYSEPGKGSAFHVYLPKVRTEENICDQNSLSPIPGGDERILIVDDEEGIVSMLQTMLEGLGYEVTAQTDSPHALKLFQADPDRFDLVITDLTMPKLGGDGLAREIRALRPDTPVILCTGFGLAIDEETAATLGIRAFLLKPVLKRDMAETIRRVLD